MTSDERKEAEEEFGRQLELVDGEDHHEQDVRMARREGALKMYEVWLRGLNLLRQYKGNRGMAMDCFFMAIGKTEDLEFKDAVGISTHYFGTGKKKAAVTKCIKYFQDRLGIPPMPGQRSNEGAVEMTRSRTGQLKTK